jgi:hypothetical protein
MTLNRLVNKLGRTITEKMDEVMHDSYSVSECIGRIREAGYDVRISFDVGVETRKRGRKSHAAKKVAKKKVNDKSFLKAVGIKAE